MSTLSRFSTVPTVDVSGLFGSLAEQQAVAREIGTAARDVGFFYVRGTGIPQALVDELLRVTMDFFALPVEQKMAVYIGRSRNHRGYVPVGEEVFSGGTADLKEAFDLAQDLPADDVDYLAGNPVLGPNQWPEVAGFKAAVSEYYEAVMAFGRVLLRGFAMALGEPADRFDQHMTKPPSQLRLIHYPFDPAAVDSQGIGAHTDYECFTLLKPTRPGLEVLNGAGEWIDVPPVEGAFVVNISDMMEIWSNGAFVATTHRVRRVTEERYSFPLFFNVDYSTVIEPLERFRRADGSDLAPLLAGDHLFAQTAQSFAYLKRRLASGEISLPEGSRALSSFGRPEQSRDEAHA